MSRIRLVFAAAAPILLAGALLGGSAATTRADDGSDVTSDVSDDHPDQDMRDATKAARDAARAAKRAAKAAKAGAMKQAWGEAHQAVRAARDEARAQIEKARAELEHDKSIPPAIRDMVLRRLDQAAQVVDRHLDKAADAHSVDAMVAELSAMGAELGQTMGGVDGDMAKMQQDMAKMGEQMAKRLGGQAWSFHVDTGDDDDDDKSDSADSDDDDDDLPTPPTAPVPPVPPVPGVAPVPPVPPAPGASGFDLSDLDVNVNLDDLQISQGQRDQLQRILDDEQRASEQAEEQITGLSSSLRGLLADPHASDADIARTIDQISAAEGVYRKARILAWAHARGVLDDAQRDALAKATRHHHGRHHGP